MYGFLKECMASGRAKHTIVPPSKYGLVQITRQRVRPEMSIVTNEKCPACGGTGEIRSSIVLLDDIESNLSYILEEQNEKGITLSVHPYIGAYIKSGLFSIRLKWFFKYGKWIKLNIVSSYHLTQFKFFNAKEEEIKL